MVTLGFVQSLLGSIVFLLKKPKHLSQTILGLWLITNSLILFGGHFEDGIVQYFKPGVFPLMFLFGPFLLFYVKSMIVENFKFKKKYLLHIIPFLAVSIHRSFTEPVSVTIAEESTINSGFNYIYYRLKLISIIIYWFVTIVIILKHKKNISNHFSYKSSRLTLSWTWVIALVYISLFLFPILYATYLKDILHFKNIDTQLFHFNLTLFSFLIILFGLRQPIIFENRNTSNPNYRKKGKYTRSGLGNKELLEIESKIEIYLKEKKPYLNPEFNLQAMSAELNISRQNLSHVLNEKMNKNFYRLINELRVLEVKKRFEANESNNLTVIGIALESGFNSKASFNRVFKEITGVTPSEYKKSLIEIS